MEEINTIGSQVIRDIIKHETGLDVRFYVDETIERNKIVKITRNGQQTGKYKIVSRKFDTGFIYPMVSKLSNEKIGDLVVKIMKENDIEYIRDQILMRLDEYPESFGIDYLK
jgi:U3 small nucleolar ribonucleoprotein component